MLRKIEITELESEDDRLPITGDVCIIGSGPAGLTIATELANTSLSVIVLESGARHEESDLAVALNQIENIGAPRILDQEKVRNRVLGGSTLTWSGRCAPLDDIDFELRSWVPYSGWPITYSEVAPFIHRAAAYLGLRNLDYSHPDVSSANETLGRLYGSDLRPVLWQFSQGSGLREEYARFGPRFETLRANNVRAYTNATVRELVLSPSLDHICEIRVLTPSRRTYFVRPRYTILCGGGIENARILLASNAQNRNGVANDHDLVGRFLGDHPRITLGTFPSESRSAVQSIFGLYRSPDGAILQRGLSPSYSVQGKNSLVNSAAWTTQHVAEDDVWRVLRDLGRDRVQNKLGRALDAARHCGQIVHGVWHKAVLRHDLPRRMGPLNLDAMLEQVPDPESRITLSDRTDPLGMPLARLDWKIGEIERRTALHLARAIDHSLARAGLPGPVLAPWVQECELDQAAFSEQAHPSGTTRMASHSQLGVVDSSCRTFGVDNLYIAGSSTFPTCGHANPTLMIVALALRIADTLKKENSNRPYVELKSGRPLQSISDSAHEESDEHEPTFQRSTSRTASAFKH